MRELYPKWLSEYTENHKTDHFMNCCSLKPIDIVVLKKLSDVVNVVPVIAKSDSLTLEERLASKERIKEEFEFHNLKMYPYEYDELDDEERAMNVQIKVCFLLLMAMFLISI